MNVSLSVRHDMTSGRWDLIHGSCPPWTSAVTPDRVVYSAWTHAISDCPACPRNGRPAWSEEACKMVLGMVAQVQAGCSCAGCQPDRAHVYSKARKRYMETGTIADRDIMLSYVTADVPDLETLGRDWEPEPAPTAVKPQAISERAPARRPQPGIAILCMIALAVVAEMITHQLAIVLPVALAGMIAASLIRPRDRRQ